MNQSTTEDAAFLEGQADQIRRLVRRSAEDIVEIGQRLIAVREREPTGGFLSWVERELDLSRSTAYRFMEVARAFRDVSQIGNFAPSALYALASGDVPDEVRESFIAKAEAEEPVRHLDVREAVQSSLAANPDDITPRSSEAAPGDARPQPVRRASATPRRRRRQQFMQTLTNPVRFGSPAAPPPRTPPDPDVVDDAFDEIHKDLVAAHETAHRLVSKHGANALRVLLFTTPDQANRCHELTTLATETRDLLLRLITDSLVGEDGIRDILDGPGSEPHDGDRA